MEALISESLLGDENSYAELIKLVEPDLYKVAKAKLRDEDDIADAIQETLIKAYQNLHTLEHKEFFKTWIIRILINECNNIINNNSKHFKLFDKSTNKFDYTSLVDETNRIDDSLYVEELLNKLDDDERELAYLYFKENFSTEKIAKMLHYNQNTVRSKLYRIRLKLKNLALIILVLFILTTTTVFAEDIINFIVSLFTTSRQAIDTAVENNYVQNVNMDFVYDKDIGIKVDYILIDDKNLNVSYVFDCKSDKNISAIELLDYTITDENGNKVFSSDLNSITQIAEHYGYQQKLDNNMFRRSYLYTAKNYFPISNNLYFNISSLFIEKDDNFTEFNGNWNFEITLENKFFNRATENYKASYNEYISNISTSIDETLLDIKINLNIPINDIEFKHNIMNNNFFLQNSSTNTNFKLLYVKSYNINNLGYIELQYDLSKYDENIDNLHLYLKLDNDKYIDIKLAK